MWDLFAGNYDVPGYQREYRCGSVHYPPNVPNGGPEYDYDSYRLIVTNKCETWDPNLIESEPAAMGCFLWGCNQEGYMRWWLKHIPNDISSRPSNGAMFYNGKTVLNWWEFIYSLDAHITSYKTNYQDDVDHANIDCAKSTMQTQLATYAVEGGQGVWRNWVNHKGCGIDNTLVVFVSHRKYDVATVQARYGGNTYTLTKKCEKSEQGGEYNSEIWYLANFPATGANIWAYFTNQAEDVFVTAYSLKSTTQTNKFYAQSCSSGTNNNPNTTVSSLVSNEVVGNLLTFTYGGVNVVTRDTGNEFWYGASDNTYTIGSQLKSTSTGTLVDYSMTHNFPWVVTAASLKTNMRPKFTTIPESISYTPSGNGIFTYQLQAVDPNNSTLTYTLLNPTTGVSVNSSTGLFTFNSLYFLPGFYRFNVKVTDGTYTDYLLFIVKREDVVNPPCEEPCEMSAEP